MKAHEIGAQVIKEALTRANIKPEDVGEVIMGQVSDFSCYTFFCNSLNSLVIGNFVLETDLLLVVYPTNTLEYKIKYRLHANWNRYR